VLNSISAHLYPCMFLCILCDVFCVLPYGVIKDDDDDDDRPRSTLKQIS